MRGRSRRREFGYGLDGLLRHRAGETAGILNGIDTTPGIPATRSAYRGVTTTSTASQRKAHNKAALQHRLGLRCRCERTPAGGGQPPHPSEGAGSAGQRSATNSRRAGRNWRCSAAANAGCRMRSSTWRARYPGQFAAVIGYDEGARSPDRGRRRHLPDAVALRALRTEPDVQPALRHAAGRARHRRAGRHGVDTKGGRSHGHANGFAFDAPDAAAFLAAIDRASQRGATRPCGAKIQRDRHDDRFQLGARAAQYQAL